MIYSPALETMLQRRPDALDVLELEPQTFWLAESPLNGPFSEFEPALARFLNHKCHKLVHSVGCPLAGTRHPATAQMELIQRVAERCRSPWVSEHLSVAGTPHKSAGFLLPPLQTAEGVECAVRNIGAFSSAVDRPVAVETGVSYLTRKSFEMEDGDYVRNVCVSADCGILLDLHNVYCNHKNGRLEMDRFLDQIPEERVWEVHLAGGMEMSGVWLDAHSGTMPAELARRARRIVRGLPNLGAINFEIYGTFLESMTVDEMDGIVDELRDIWSEAGKAQWEGTFATAVVAYEQEEDVNFAPVRDWEAGLTEAVWRSDATFHPYPEDAAAMALYSELAASFRGSMLVRLLPRVVRYIMVSRPDAGDAVFGEFFRSVPSQLYATLEVKAFDAWMLQHNLADEWLKALLGYDIAVAEVQIDHCARTVMFPGDPRPLFESLAVSQIPDAPLPPVWELEILPDQMTETDYVGTSASS